jgi:hypothetical protein
MRNTGKTKWDDYFFLYLAHEKQSVSMSINEQIKPATPPQTKECGTALLTPVFQGYGWCFVMGNRKYNYKKGDVVNGVMYLDEAPSGMNKMGHKIRMCYWQCMCGKVFISVLGNILNGKTSSCGCARLTHGRMPRLLYQRWATMKQRCNNDNVNGYKNYGGRGIKVCEEWSNSFESFRDYVMNLPDAFRDGYTIDRINTGGNYEPGNVRWADRHIQAANKSLSTNNNSGYVGISYYNRLGKWKSELMVNGEIIRTGYFKTKKEALKSRNDYIRENGLWEYPIQKWTDADGVG